jgi:hypothetical protein
LTFFHIISIITKNNHTIDDPGCRKICKDLFAQPQQHHNILRALADGIALGMLTLFFEQDKMGRQCQWMDAEKTCQKIVVLQNMSQDITPL